ncbi:DUF1654 domain-containing protein [Pseudomonas luteola]
MPRRSAVVAVPPTSFDKLANRVQAMVNSPRAQIDKKVSIDRLEHECPEDWQRLLDEIAENENVTLSHGDNGAVHLAWTEM